MMPFAWFAVAPVAVASEDGMGVYGLAQGGAVGANPRSNDARLVNPATNALFERYDAQFLAAAGGRRLLAGASVVDSRTRPQVALGLGYRYVYEDPPLTESELPGWILAGETPTNRRHGHNVDASLAIPFAKRKASFGLGGSVEREDHERRGGVWDGDLDLGFSSRPVDSFAFGLVGRDLLPLASADHPAKVGASLWFGAQDVGGFGVDAAYRVAAGDGAPIDVSAGFERTLGGAALFGGYHYDGRYDWHAAALGAGWRQEGTWLDLGVDVPFASPFDARAITVQLGVRIEAGQGTEDF